MEPDPILLLDFATLSFVDFANSPIFVSQHAVFLGYDICGRRYEIQLQSRFRGKLLLFRQLPYLTLRVIYFLQLRGI